MACSLCKELSSERSGQLIWVFDMSAVTNLGVISLCDDEMVVHLAHLFFYEFARRQGVDDRQLSQEIAVFLNSSEGQSAFLSFDDSDQVRLIRQVLREYAIESETNKSINAIFQQAAEKLDMTSLASAVDWFASASCLSMIILSMRIKAIDFKKGVTFSPIDKACSDFVRSLPSLFNPLIGGSSDNANHQ